MDNVRNIAAYKFALLQDLKSLRERLLAFCKARKLKGTILLSAEGINLFVAGTAEAVEALLGELRAVPGLEALEAKASKSAHQPFTRMLVRIKKEIIAFGVEGIQPALHPSPKISPRTLKQWLDEGRPLTLLDTRNDYEVKLGTFRRAQAAGIGHFRHFPDAVRRLPESMKEQPIVMFCTGGIRCEKAGPFMEREGFKNIFQLDGGILKYFEECGGAHYEGECFVFDQRVGVDPCLRETASAQCFQCLVPLTEEEQRDPRYAPNQSCPYCFKSSSEQMAEVIAQREEAIRQAVTPLPGSQPYDNFRPISVPAHAEGLPVLDFLGKVFGHTPQKEWRDICERGLLLDREKKPVSLSHRVRAGERLWHKLPATVEPEVNADIRILHEDEALIVLNKPAPLPMHPCGRFNRNSLQHILARVYAPQKPRPAHRLDANTTGLVLLCRTQAFAARLQPQFARGEVEKVYLTRAQGLPPQDVFECNAPIGSEPVEAGARKIDCEKGQEARTLFRVLRREAGGAALLEARPLTGRTNQIRIHLWQMGWPVCGDPVYLPGSQRGSTQTLGLHDPPLCLHASRVAFSHPLTGARVEFSAPPPSWAGTDFQR